MTDTHADAKKQKQKKEKKEKKEKKLDSELHLDSESEIQLDEEKTACGKENKKESKKKKDKKDKKDKKEEDFKSKYYYLAAEMENSRKRFTREREQLLKFGNEKILRGLIDVIDNFDHTISALDNEEDEKIKNIISGINMVRDQFLDVLSKNGLIQIDSIGKIFDPQYHEAMGQQSVEGKQEHEIIMEYQRGYLLNDRLLRPSKVVIAKNS